MKKVYICSPYRADSKEELRENIAAARRMCREAVDEGNLVLCPHLLYPQFLRDEVEEEREKGIRAGLAMLEMADEIWMLSGKVSPGMCREIARAGELGIPVVSVCDPMVAEEHLLNMVLFGKETGKDGKE